MTPILSNFVSESQLVFCLPPSAWKIRYYLGYLLNEDWVLKRGYEIGHEGDDDVFIHLVETSQFNPRVLSEEGADHGRKLYWCIVLASTDRHDPLPLKAPPPEQYALLKVLEKEVEPH
ncbi:hypothetical protein BV22DRAFT_571362 [Leucogyrophana mollusca]|uniref:Uncharacterized protein n=1 Tax=Leucogyrophana mollusca TaxID=85980 RepID=A0ACB8BGB1_9AGAM|nr:hypothetical protein BV22DRAFT_571362 [Leucogyrophana mollusca]